MVKRKTHIARPKAHWARPKTREDEDVIRFDFDMNYTLEVDGDTWRDLLEVCDGDVKEAIVQLSDELESDMDEQNTVSGRAWPCSLSREPTIIEDLTRKREEVS